MPVTVLSAWCSRGSLLDRRAFQQTQTEMDDHPQHPRRIFHKNTYLMLTFLKLQKGDKCYMFDTHMFHELGLEVAGLAYSALG